MTFWVKMQTFRHWHKTICHTGTRQSATEGKSKRINIIKKKGWEQLDAVERHHGNKASGIDTKPVDTTVKILQVFYKHEQM